MQQIKGEKKKERKRKEETTSDNKERESECAREKGIVEEAFKITQKGKRCLRALHPFKTLATLRGIAV